MTRKAYELKIKWSKDYNAEEALEHDDKDYEFFYMVYRKRKYIGSVRYRILYIGMTYYQFLSDRLRNHHKFGEIIEDQCGKGEVVVKFGNIILSPQRKISEKLVRDVEAALIQEVKPEYNEMSTFAYSGRELKITNLGKYTPLNRTINTEDWEVI